MAVRWFRVELDSVHDALTSVHRLIESDDGAHLLPERPGKCEQRINGNAVVEDK